MNLHGIASRCISAINPMTRLTMQRSTGSVTGVDGSRVSTYDPPVEVFGQVQDLTSDDLRQLEGLNLQGDHRLIYLEGHWEGLNRLDEKGGDLIIFPDGKVWLIVKVVEQWPEWCKVAVTLQNGS